MVIMYPMVNHSLRMDYIMLQIFAFLLCSFFILKYFSTKKEKHLYLTGIALGIAFLINYSSLFFALIISLFVLWKTRNLKDTIIMLFKIGITAAFVCSLFPLLSLLFEPNIFLRTLTLGNKFSVIPNLKVFVYLFVFVGPLLVGLFIKSLFSKEKVKNYSLFLIWVVLLITSIVFTKWYEMVDRYIILIAPALCIIGGHVLSSFKWDKRRIALFLISFIMWFGVIFLVNSQAYPIPVGIDNYISEAKDSNLNFILPFTGRTGPMFGISFLVVVASIIISFWFLLLSFGWDKFFVVFFAVAFAFNMLVVQEFLVPVMNPDYSEVTYDLIDSAQGLPKPIYGNNYALVHYLGIGHDDYVSLYGEYANVLCGTDTDYIERMLTEKGGTAIVVDFPYLDRGGGVWQLLENNCELYKRVYSNGKPAGSLFSCEAR